MIGQYQNKMTIGEQIVSIMYRPALMAPKANRIDCFYCRYRDLDSDGVPDGCDLPVGGKCVAPGRRNPWGDWK